MRRRPLLVPLSRTPESAGPVGGGLPIRAAAVVGVSTQDHLRRPLLVLRPVVAVVLDFIGLVDLAVDAGHARWAVALVVVGGPRHADAAVLARVRVAPVLVCAVLAPVAVGTLTRERVGILEAHSAVGAWIWRALVQFFTSAAPPSSGALTLHVLAVQGAHSAVLARVGVASVLHLTVAPLVSVLAETLVLVVFDDACSVVQTGVCVAW